ncbi:7SK snRNA methylphosphate capping enzyme [Ceratobasidium theobromae]|uniref:RNA methyltransferase n=1 Tax=Ceratobasidium theobromae TaxID=1582974 RepID=A0A5N5QMJ4_9AGAM|nr:7SK snRNA methylphosphate capping enzyme [Ceratobasidium theobromae]
MPRAERAAPYGNYKGYYAKRGNHSSDPRLKALPAGIFDDKRVLDIGCNEGWVTCEIARNYNARNVVGVDVDTELISRAWRHRREVWSLQKPAEIVGNFTSSIMHGDRPTEQDLDSLHGSSDSYFPDCFPFLFGPIPISAQNSSFPNNVSFYASNWANQGCPADQQGYDVVVAFSVTKWIHLHGGDEGIKLFFSRVRDVLLAHTNKISPGIFVLEAQPWSGYHSAMRKINLCQPKDQRSQDRVKINPDEFSNILIELGFSKPQRVGIIGEGGFKRPIDIYELCGA